MKKLLFAVMLLALQVSSTGCLALAVSKTTVDKPGMHVETLDPGLARQAASSDASNGLDPACAEMVRQGRASYVRTDNGVTCYVFANPGEGGGESSLFQIGYVENWTKDDINFEMHDQTGMMSRSFTVKANSAYKTDFPPGFCYWTATATNGTWTTGSALPINAVRNDNESALAKTKADFVIRVVPK